MSNEILKIQRWKKTHKELLMFIESRDVRTGNEIRNWIAQCIVYFTEVGVPQNIVDYFLSKLDYHKERGSKKLSYLIIGGDSYGDEDDKYHYKTGIGPFTFDEDAKGYIVRDIANRLTESKQVDRTKMTPVLVSFKVAENIIDNYEDGERIIPKILVNEFDTEKTRGIFLAIQSIQSAYEKKNTRDILASLITTTSLVFDLIPELKLVKDIGPKIKKTYETEKIYKKYNLNREVLWSINNSRIIRNYDIHDPKEANQTNLYEAVGYCHLLVLLISSLFASGEINLK